MTPLKCPICKEDKTFETKGNLKRHLKLNHAITEDRLKTIMGDFKNVRKMCEVCKFEVSNFAKHQKTRKHQENEKKAMELSLTLSDNIGSNETDVGNENEKEMKKKSAVRYTKKSEQKPKPKVIPLMAKHNPRPHRCGACRFYENQNKRSYSKQLAKLAPFIMDHTIVPHYEHPNDFADPEYKYMVMQRVYMIDSAKKAKEIYTLRKQLQQKESDIKKLQEENLKFRKQLKKSSKGRRKNSKLCKPKE